MNVFTFMYNFFSVLVDYSTLLWEFLTTEITIGTITILPIFAIGTGAIITLITWRLIKEFVI